MHDSLPAAIRQVVAGAPLLPDTIGESPCRVHAFRRGRERFFLKICPAVHAATTYSVRREARVLDWLAGKLSVAEVVAVAEHEGEEFMVTRAVPGVPLSARLRAGLPVTGLFREALRQLQAVPVSDCPFDSGAAMRLRELDYLLARDLIDPDHDLSQWPGLDTPQALLAHLQAHLPDEDPVFSHGDLCDSNVFVDAHDRLHFIDLGRGGVADRWLDVAFAHRNLREDVGDEAARALLATIGVPDRPDRRRFFEQLDELF